MPDTTIIPALHKQTETGTGLLLDERLRLLLASPEPLRAWLQAQQTPLIGHSSDSARCPLAMFLTERVGGNVSVYTDTVTLFSAWHGRYQRTMLASCALPTWARSFVCGIDRPPANDGTEKWVRGPVLRDRALALLPSDENHG